jgi:hypothetical protein
MFVPAMDRDISLDDMTKTRIVFMILNKRTEEALQLLSLFYNTTPPRIAVGTIKGKRKTVYALYVQKEGKIFATNSEILYNPFIMLHEFYHHIRTKADVHRGKMKGICSLRISLMHIIEQSVAYYA